MSDPQVPFKKTEHKVDSFAIYYETESHDKSHLKNCLLSPTYSIPKIKTFAQHQNQLNNSQQY